MDTSTTSLTLKLREFEFGEDDFQALRALVRQVTGISLSEQKRELVYGRLARRLRALNLKSFRDYRALLSQDDGTELVQFCNAITTNLTAFFREPHHFEHLKQEVLGPMLKNPPPGRRVRIWSAGCSTGEEPYSIAMSVLEAVPDLERWDIRILATDLDSDVLEKARRGVYSAERLQTLSAERRERFFEPYPGAKEPSYKVRPEVARLLTVKQLNLMHAFPMKGPLDVIFCRNVVIYFDKDTQRDLVARISRLQRPGDLLFLGHSETLFKVSTDYTLIGRTIYRRS
ncbi:MAG TPA: protein-glutamate O-methyltransferase CheR [Steroidobacteraceae bacterium]|nr:protein-glutamate O-methyltransferase CheR [Steroidobacteraceae bacterium]